MTQIATVTALPAGVGGQVEVTVVRQSACAHDCGSCGGCGGRTASLAVRADSDIPLAMGDKVEISGGGNVLGAAALVYLGPVVLFLLGYLLPSALPEGGRNLCGGLGFLLGLAGAVACDRWARRRTGAGYRVIRKL